MKFSRSDRVQTLLQKMTADFLKNELETKALVTVTDIIVSKDLHAATALVSIFPDQNEKEILKFLNVKKKGALAEYIASHAKMKATPSVITFALDKGEKNRQKIDALLGTLSDKPTH